MTNLMFSPSSFVIADALKKDPSFCQDWAWLEKVADKLPALTRQVAHYVDAKAGVSMSLPKLKNGVYAVFNRVIGAYPHRQ